MDDIKNIIESLLFVANEPLSIDQFKRIIGQAETNGNDLDKVEATVLELVRAGFTVRRMLEVIPEPDPEIYRALVSLSESGVISV